LYALQASLPPLTRSALQRQGISRLPEVAADKPAKKKFKLPPIGYVHIDIAQLSTEERKLYLFVAIDRACKFAYAELHKMVAAQFLRHLIEQVPYKLHTVLTDNGIQLTNRKTDHFAFPHLFSRVCQENSFAHRFTQVNHLGPMVKQNR
jgi:hypothetical protein